MKSILLIFVIGILQSCGDTKTPPSTQPQNGPQIISQPHQPQELTETYPFETAVSVDSNKKLFRIYLVWKQPPTAGMDGLNIADIVLKATDPAASVELLRFQPKMNCCGTKPPQKQKITPHPHDTGRFEIKSVYFHAAGAENGWTILVDTKVNGQNDRAELIIEKVLPN